MIPSLVVSDIRAALVEFLATTFALADDEVRDELAEFLTDANDGIFRGPYLRVRTPFRAVDARVGEVAAGLAARRFLPYLHQATAFERLSTAGGRIAAADDRHDRHRVGQDRVLPVSRSSTTAPASAPRAKPGSRR